MYIYIEISICIRGSFSPTTVCRTTIWVRSTSISRYTLLQYLAMCGSVLPCVAVCCSVLQREVYFDH